MMIRCALIIIAVTQAVSSQFLVETTNCKDNEVLCGDKSKCIPVYSVCDYTYDCEDQSDEELNLCKKIQSLKSDCSAGNVKCTLSSRACMNLNAACKSPSTCIINSLTFTELCEDIMTKTLKPNYAVCSSRNKTLDVIGHLASAFKETNCSSEEYSCPPLYVRVGNKCISFFTPAEIGWNEAKAFCESISGNLITINDFESYGEILTYINNNAMKSKFWIGGQFTYLKGKFAWKWLDGSLIPMGAPFWSVYYQTNCTATTPAKNCVSTYELMPRSNELGNCLAIDIDFFYYFSDENCLGRKSPICLFNRA